MLLRHNNKRQGAKLLLAALTFSCTQQLFAKVERTEVRGAYDELALLHMPALAGVELGEQKERAELTQRNKETAEKEKNKFTFFAKSKLDQLKDVEDIEVKKAESLRLLYDIFQENEPKYDGRNALQKNVCQDLTLFCGDVVHPESHLFGSLDHTATIAGKIQLQKMLYEPATDIAELEKRQAAVRLLVENEEVFNVFQSIVDEVKRVEKDVLWFRQDFDETLSEYFNIPFIQNALLKGKNNDATMLELVHRQRTVFTPIMAALLPVTAHISPYIFLKFIEAEEAVYRPIPEAQRLTFIKMLKNSCLVAKEALRMVILGQVKPSVFERGAPEHLRFDVPFPVRLVVASGIALAGYTYYKQLASALEVAKINNLITDKLQGRLISMGSMVRACTRIAKVSKIHPALAQGLTSLEVIQKAFDPKASDKEVVELVNLLLTDTFTEEPSVFSFRGEVLRAFGLMQKHTSKVINLMKTVGEADAFLSIAKLVKKYQNNPNARFNFVQFRQAAEPALEITGFWHPMLDANKVVKNSVSLGRIAGYPQNMIITGPNAGGKSTALKAIILSVILAQTVGIAPADEMTITPFKMLNTYLNITDSVGYASLFQAELNRAKKLVGSITTLPVQDFSFVILDEIFTGTNPEEGARGSESIINMLNGLGNNIAIIATHYHSLTDLEAKTKGRIVNYKVSVNKSDAGVIQYLYKLDPGISDQKIALELVNQALGGFGLA